MPSAHPSARKRSSEQRTVGGVSTTTSNYGLRAASNHITQPEHECQATGGRVRNSHRANQSSASSYLECVRWNGPASLERGIPHYEPATVLLRHEGDSDRIGGRVRTTDRTVVHRQRKLTGD